MRYQTMYRLLVVTVFLLLMTVGIYLGKNYISKLEIKKSQEVSNVKEENNEVYKEPIQVVTKDVEESQETDETKEAIVVNLVDNYLECGHIATKQEDIISKTKENAIKEINSKDKEYSFVKEQDNILIFEKNHNGKCTEHYLVKLEDSEIKIYKMGQNNKYEFFQSLGITQETIREDLITALTDGIEANGLEELYIIIEDVES